MASKLTRKQKRDKKKKLDRKVQMEVQRVQRESEFNERVQAELEQQKILERNQAEAVKQQAQQSVQDNTRPSKIVMNYIADRNGCGYFRSIWPFELLSTYRQIMGTPTFLYSYDQQVLTFTDIFRFQRQATDTQLEAFVKYIKIRQQYGFNYKMSYEIDDLLMEISPDNKIAYDYFDDKKKQNHMNMLNASDIITFSTEALKEIYVRDYGIDESRVKVVKNHLPQFMYSLPYRNIQKDFNKTTEKPRIFWSGSASHVGKGGDLEFLLPMIEKTVDEYQWVFQGTIPNSLIDYVKQGKIEFISWVPVYGLANVQFYKARPDICLAPLKPSRFNTCKSDLKYLESCALGAPCITTSFDEANLKSPYDIAESEICIEPDADIWKTMIDHLVEDKDYYADVRKKQYDFVNGRWMEQNLDEWENSLK